MHPDRRALLLGLAAVALWSTVATAFKIALRHLDVFQLLFVASAVSSTLLLGVVCLRGQARLLTAYFRATPGYFLVVALLNPCSYYLVLLTAYDLLPAQQAQAINYTWAIMLTLMAMALLGQRPGVRDILASVVGYGGVLIIATRGDPLSLEFDDSRGVMLAVLSTVIWAYYWIISTRNQRDPAVSLCINFLIATPITLVVCLALSSPVIRSVEGIAAAAYVGLFEMGLTFLLWSAALRSASRVVMVSNLIFLAPFLSLLFIQGVLGEAIHPATLVGLCLIVPAALLQQLRSNLPGRKA